MTNAELLDEAHEVANAVATELRDYRSEANGAWATKHCRTLGLLQIKAERLCQRIERELPDEEPTDDRLAEIFRDHVRVVR